jgi:hypothetical protein
MKKAHRAVATVLCFAGALAGERMAVSGNQAGEKSAMSFSAPLALKTGEGPTHLAAGDVNADGFLDVLTSNQRGNSVSIFLSDGKGGFRQAQGSPFAAGPRPHLIALGDFDRDARLDLAVTEHDSHDVRVYRGFGDGRFRLPGALFAALGRGKPHNHGLTAVDVNADAALDLVTSNQNDDSVSVLLGDGRGNFTAAPGSPFAVGREPYPPAVGDVNSDRMADIVAPNVTGGSISVLKGDGTGSFRAASAISVLPRPYFVAIGDLNSDGKPDLAIAHDDIPQLTLLLGDGAGNFRPAPGSPVDAGARGMAIFIADMNGDRSPELVFAAGSQIIVLTRDAAGRFAPALRLSGAGMHGAWQLAVADWNRDARLDIAAADVESHQLLIFWGR